MKQIVHLETPLCANAARDEHALRHMKRLHWALKSSYICRSFYILSQIWTVFQLHSFLHLCVWCVWVALNYIVDDCRIQSNLEMCLTSSRVWLSTGGALQRKELQTELESKNLFVGHPSIRGHCHQVLRCMNIFVLAWFRQWQLTKLSFSINIKFMLLESVQIWFHPRIASKSFSGGFLYDQGTIARHQSQTSEPERVSRNGIVSRCHGFTVWKIKGFEVPWQVFAPELSR